MLSREQDLPRLHPAPQEEVSTPLPSSDELTPAALDALFAVSARRVAVEGHDQLVLAVDDNPDAITLIEAALKNTSYTVVAVQDPLHVMEQVRELHPCAITLDVMMPGLNGWQLLNQLKADPATASIPVVMVTVVKESTTGYVIGADAYLLKPFKNDVLLHTLEELTAHLGSPSQASRGEAQSV
jgi:CheY-like chemotaxis protein